MTIQFPAPLNLYLPLAGGALTGGLTVALGAITADQQNYAATATWNNVAITFTAVKVNITDSASASGSLLMDLQVGASSKFSISKTGAITTAGGITVSGSAGSTFGSGGFVVAGRAGMNLNGTGNISMFSGGAFGWTAGTDPGAAFDTTLARLSAGVIQSNGQFYASAATPFGTKTTATNGAAAALGTLTNAPTAGNPTKWVPFDDNGTTRYIPMW